MLAASTNSPVFGTLLVLHVLAAAVGFGAMLATSIQGWRLGRAQGPDEVAAIRRYFRPGVNWAARCLYLVPVLGVTLVLESGGVYHFDDGFVDIGVTLWVVAVAVAESVLWPAERRVQQLLQQGWNVPSDCNGAGSLLQRWSAGTGSDGEQSAAVDGEQSAAVDGEQSAAVDGERRAVFDGEQSAASDDDWHAVAAGEQRAVVGGEQHAAVIEGEGGQRALFGGRGRDRFVPASEQAERANEEQQQVCRRLAWCAPAVAAVLLAAVVVMAAKP